MKLIVQCIDEKFPGNGSGMSQLTLGRFYDALVVEDAMDHKMFDVIDNNGTLIRVFASRFRDVL